LASRAIDLARGPVAPPAPNGAGIWATRASWSRDLENMYSAWIETLFDAPEAASPSWDALEDVLRDPRRNLLFDYLGTNEDSVDPPGARPDCADLPYFLRAYFAFKLGLPFGVSECDRGRAGSPPKCHREIATNEARPPADDQLAGAQARFGRFLATTVANRAHSGSGRIPFDDEVSDYYPVPISAESLRPGTVYADPYGHVLVIAARLPQSEARGGGLFAVDAQPDGTVRRKRFWEGNFLFSDDRTLGGVGWKRFRPVSRIGGALVRWGDRAIRESPDYSDLASDAGSLGRDAFFQAVDDALSPKPLDPRRELLDGIAALEDMVRVRVDSVDSGREWLSTARGPVPMPPLADLFEAMGTWEDLSTPSRDLRLLVALDLVESLPGRVKLRPERYRLPPGTSAAEMESELRALLARELSSRTISYLRSDGSSFTLSLTDVLGRKVGFEVAYNPNDCPEVRWGAPLGSDEMATCRAHAPPEQQRQMQAMRTWFHERRRPPRR
jgi:hypothetical protein